MKLRNICLALALVGGLTSCYDLLEEKPLDFLTPENSYTNKKGFEAALAGIYSNIRTYFYANTDSWQNFDMLGVDIDLCSPRSGESSYPEYFYWNTLNADNSFSKKWWSRLYSMIYSCNVIIDRSESEYAEWVSDEEKNAIVGEAKFLRAFAYRF